MLTVLAVIPLQVRAAELSRPNILFLAVDDLRPELGCFGEPVISPNIDRLAAKSVRFDRAYCTVPTCGASRASIFTGLRPTATRFVTASTSAQKDAPGTVTLNTHFRNHGYHTVSLGKVFHIPGDNAHGWSETPWVPAGVPEYFAAENMTLHEQRAKIGEKPDRGPAWESADQPDTDYEDSMIATRAIADLQRICRSDKPFFLAVGFKKPHLPFVAPQKYWDLYDRDQIESPKDYLVPQGAPAEAIHDWGELRHYSGIPQTGPVSDDAARKLIHGYKACISFVDSQIGQLLNELDVLGLNDNTIIMLWGDHGWNLGEHTLWCKHSCFEVSMRVPLIVHAPGISPGSTQGLTELVDMYPTLCDLAGIPLPDHLQGDSLVPLLRDPKRQWKSAAYGRFRQGNTVRTEQFRYTQYTNNTGHILSQMLYNHVADPGENTNIAVDKDNASISETHSVLLSDLKLQSGDAP
ncbi:MAG: sulfatase [Planctomycetaceae bacterium]|nr:sulfatase [Planctomycetaceae bacterium]